MRWRSLTRSIQPAVEPVSLLEMKQHLRVDSESDDSYIMALVTAAREWVEVYLDRTLITTQWTMRLDAFPTMARQLSEAYQDRTFIATQLSVRADIFPPDIELPRPPMSLSNMTSVITYVTADGTTTTLPTNQYRMDSYSTPGAMRPLYSGSWPSHRVDQNAVSISWYAGYGDSGQAVPRQIRHAIMMMVNLWYERRVAADVAGLVETPLGVKTLLDSCRWGGYQ
jgi:uncharacterized phiE125 gp8 family phage protein